jgi:cytochrome o ubiquinol oxidase subunit I
VIPQVHDHDPFWEMKKHKIPQEKPVYRPIHMPKDTHLGFYIGAIACVFGFAMTWHITWLSLASFFGVIACLVAHVIRKDTSYYVPVSEIEKIEAANHKGYA